MRDETFSVKYISVHNCFLHFSERWLEKLKGTDALACVLKQEYGSKKCGYFSWSSESHSSSNNNNNDNIVGISATYAQKLGLKDGEKVTVSLCSSISPVSRVNVTPVTADDWEILEMNSSLVQSSVLDQVRVVWSKQILVIWISRCLHLSLHVDGFDSTSAAGLLEPLSDVVVTPPGTNTSVEHTDLQTDLLRQKLQKCDDQIENLKTSQSLVSVIWNALRSYMSDSSANKEDMLVKCLCRTEAEHQTIAVLKKYNDNPLPVVYRVHPLHLPSSKLERKSEDNLLLHPYNVFVRRCCMPSVDTDYVNSRKGVLTCKLIRVSDPSGFKASRSKHGSKNDESHMHENSMVSSLGTVSASVHVLLYVIEDIYMSLSDSFKEYLDKVTVNKEIGHDSLLVSAVTRSVLGVEIGERVNLEVVDSAAMPLLSEIQITPLGNWENSTKELETLCRSYIAEQVKTHCLLINSESFLPLQATSSSTTHVLVSLLPAGVEYVILYPDIVRKCKFRVKENTSHLIYPSADKELGNNDAHSVQFGNNFQKLVSEGITTLEMSLHLTPLVTKLLPFRTNLTSDNILIVGPAGSGKTTLARTICKELGKPPYFVHSIEIQCKHLKGMLHVLFR
ncbi:Peroxisome biogenesis factor 1 [Zootermopsis nevadensis]|uniref:Peroxisome biogenesis factor 1 n=1 Tax=Zootermopsis nevadensis TaxID=136037 RepID=A0A067R3W6_ZOONE|nr:Peroxisome biogenesis factor 1 [Zootermopsis nevadensis]